MWSPVLLTSFLATYITTETLVLQLEKLIIKDPQLPSNFNNLRVCFLSDLHHGHFSSLKRLNKMIDKIKTLQPDLILLGGDYLQTLNRKKNSINESWQELLALLQKLPSTTYGKYAVMGNHDYVLPISQVRKDLAHINIKLLHNEGLFLYQGKQKIYLGGVGDLWYGNANLKQTLSSRVNQNKDFILLLSHQPNFIDQLSSQDGVNFILAGHTHGAQCSLFNYKPFMPKAIAHWEYTVGLIETLQTRMLVSPGVGNVAPYFRFFSTPKIHLLKFKSAPRLTTASVRP